MINRWVRFDAYFLFWIVFVMKRKKKRRSSFCEVRRLVVLFCFLLKDPIYSIKN